MKLEITDSQYKAIVSGVLNLYPRMKDRPNGPTRWFMDMCRRCIGPERFDEALAAESVTLVRVKDAVVKLADVVPPPATPRAKPKLPESMRLRLIAEGKLKDDA